MDAPAPSADFQLPAGRRRGRPPRDPLEALRARVWYWHVKVASGWTDYRLNEHFGPQLAMRGPGEAQRKVFERIRRLGVVPRDKVWTPSTGTSAGGLIDRVEQYAPCAGTEAIFRSDFWLLMKRPNIPLAELKEMIHSQCWILGMMRPHHGQIWEHEHKDLIGGGETQAYQDGIKQLREKNSLDSAALLGALFKEALWFGETEIATLLKTAFMQTMMTYSERFESNIEDPNIAPFADRLRSDMSELLEQAMRHIIFSAGETKRGDHAEVMYPIFAIGKDGWLPLDVWIMP